MTPGERVRGGGAAVATALLLSACVVSNGTTEVPEDPEVSGVSVAPIDDPVAVEVDGKRITTRCAGDPDDPSVMLVSGLGAPMDLTWDPVQGQIGAYAHACAYDRLGVGASGRPPRSHTFQDMAAQLDLVMQALELDPPVVLVAHALGGMVAAAYAEEHTDDVAGLVLLDAAGPGYPESLLQRLPGKSGSKGGAERDLWEELLDPSANREHLDGRSAFAEAESFTPIGDVPLVALTHSIPEHLDSTTPEQQADLESAWEAGQHRWLALSSASTLERVDLAGHDIQQDAPLSVIEWVRAIVER